MVAGSAAIAAPFLPTPSSPIPHAKGTEKTDSGKARIYYITRQCIGCQVCRTFCLAKAINFGDNKNEIDQSKCRHCGTCYRECPICVITET